MLSRFCRKCIRRQSTLRNTFNASQKKGLWPDNHENKVGLFGIPELTDPSGFEDLQKKTHDESSKLVSEVIEGGNQRRLVNVFDELSDTLCQLADMADFVRVAHPDVEYSESAESARVSISELVEKLNTNVKIHDALKKSIDDGVCKDNEVERRVEKLFLFDFQQSGIHLPKDKRAKFVDINNELHYLGSEFMVGCHQPSVLTSHNALPHHLRNIFNIGPNGLKISGPYSENESPIIREAGYMAFNMPRQNQQSLLYQLLDKRRNLAKLVGFNSFADKELNGTLAGSASYVSNFLEEVSAANLPLAVEELEELRLTKTHHRVPDKLNSWDIPYYTQRTKLSHLPDITEYLSLGNCMQGISELFYSIYGIRLIPTDIVNGEVWHQDIHKVTVMDDNDNKLGVIYCDFYDRPGKPQDCHFTIRAGRKIDENTYQNPIVVITLSLPKHSNRPTLLAPSMLENLFHEFGHAMHSMLGRTVHQHVAGTRCVTDLAEVPSVLMEYFAYDARVLSTFARHWKTGEPIPEERLHAHCNSKGEFAAMDTQLQILYSLLDQQLHSANYRNPEDILMELQEKHYILPHVENTAWFHRFAHFVGYGAKYYSYLTSRAVASQIWKQCFNENPFSRNQGELYRKHILSHGGEIEPRVLIENLLGKGTTEQLSESLIWDIKSMKMINEK